MAEVPKGYLVITAIEASGKNKDENYVWDSADFEGCVKSACGAQQGASRACSQTAGSVVVCGCARRVALMHERGPRLPCS